MSKGSFMQTIHFCALIYIVIKSEVCTITMFKPSGNF